MSTNFFMAFNNFNFVAFFKSIFNKGNGEIHNDKVRNKVINYIDKISKLDR